MTIDSLLSLLGLTRSTADLADIPLPAARDLGFFHPCLPRPLQVIGCAADVFLDGQPWSGPLPQALIVGSDASVSAWQQKAAALQIPAYCSPWPSQTTVDRLRQALGGRMAPRQQVHATLVRVLDLGLLLLGASGTGKSELALELVSRGHPLVADDAVEVSRPAPGCLLGECPEQLRGFIEVRGLGILDLRASYGEAAIAACARLDLAVRIDLADPHNEPADRLHGRRRSLDLLGIAIPEILLPARLGHNAVMVEAACRDHWLRLGGYVASEAFVAAHDRRSVGASKE